MEFIFFLFPLMLIFGTHLAVVRPFISGKLEIDKHQFPTVAHIQRVLRARNPEARNRELESTLKTLRQDASKSWYDQEKIHKDHLDSERKKHNDALTSWQRDFIAAHPPKPAGAPNVQEARFHGVIEESPKTKWAEDEALYNAKVRAWSGINPPPEDVKDSPRSTELRTNVRTEPTSQSRLWGILEMKTPVFVSGWIYGESLAYPDPNNIWFRLNLVGSSEPVYIWSGAVNNKSTKGLTDLNPPLKSEFHQYLEVEAKAMREIKQAAEKNRRQQELADQLADLNYMVDKLPKKLNLNNTGSDHDKSSLFAETRLAVPVSTRYDIF